MSNESAEMVEEPTPDPLNVKLAEFKCFSCMGDLVRAEKITKDFLLKFIAISKTKDTTENVKWNTCIHCRKFVERETLLRSRNQFVNLFIKKYGFAEERPEVFSENEDDNSGDSDDYPVASHMSNTDDWIQFYNANKKPVTELPKLSALVRRRKMRRTRRSNAAPSVSGEVLANSVSAERRPAIRLIPPSGDTASASKSPDSVPREDDENQQPCTSSSVTNMSESGDNAPQRLAKSARAERRPAMRKEMLIPPAGDTASKSPNSVPNEDDENQQPCTSASVTNMSESGDNAPQKLAKSARAERRPTIRKEMPIQASGIVAASASKSPIPVSSDDENQQPCTSASVTNMSESGDNAPQRLAKSARAERRPTIRKEMLIPPSGDNASASKSPDSVPIEDDENQQPCTSASVTNMSESGDNAPQRLAKHAEDERRPAKRKEMPIQASGIDAASASKSPIPVSRDDENQQPCTSASVANMSESGDNALQRLAKSARAERRPARREEMLIPPSGDTASASKSCNSVPNEHHDNQQPCTSASVTNKSKSVNNGLQRLVKPTEDERRPEKNKEIPSKGDDNQQPCTSANDTNVSESGNNGLQRLVKPVEARRRPAKRKNIHIPPSNLDAASASKSCTTAKVTNMSKSGGLQRSGSRRYKRNRVDTPPIPVERSKSNGFPRTRSNKGSVDTQPIAGERPMSGDSSSPESCSASNTNHDAQPIAVERPISGDSSSPESCSASNINQDAQPIAVKRSKSFLAECRLPFVTAADETECIKVLYALCHRSQEYFGKVFKGMLKGTDLTEITCSCDKTYVRPLSLQMHLLNNCRFHLKKNVCKLCNRETMGLDQLKQHLKEHIVPPRCRTCHKTHTGLRLIKHLLPVYFGDENPNQCSQAHANKVMVKINEFLVSEA